MRNKIKISLLAFVVLAIFLVPSCFAATVLEDAENYTEGAIIYGSTRFDTDVIITAGEAFNAGINESKVWVALGNKLNDLEPVTPYFYDGASWYKIVNDEENPAVPVTETEDIKEIEDNLHIFFVNNEMKTIEVPYDGNVDEGSVTDGAKYDKTNKKFVVPALSFNFEFTNDGAKVEVNTNVDTNKKEENTGDDIKEPEIINKEVAAIGSTKYEDLTKAFAEAKEGETVKLLANVDIPTAIKVDKKVTLNLNGKTITAKNDPNGDGLFMVVTGGDLTIEGEGTLDAACTTNNYSMAIWAKETGKVTINGGTYTNVGAKPLNAAGKTNNNDMIYARGNAVITINAGTFIGNTANVEYGPRFTLNLKDSERETSAIIVKGGTYTAFNPANNLAEGVGTNFVAEGYKSVYNEANNTYTVVAYDANNVTEEAELKHFMTEGGTVKLGSDIELAEKSIGLSKDVVLDLNGHKISISENYSSNNVIWTSAKLTVKGNGTIDTRKNEEEYFVALYAYNGGDITIENGTFIGIPDAEVPSDIIYARGNGSKVTINGGTFIGDETFTLNLYDSDRDVASIVVKGGTFTGFNPANNAAENAGTNFVAEGYRSVYNEADNTYTVKAYDVNNVDDDDSLIYALAHAKEGDTINLAAGDYSKVLIDIRKNVAKNLTLVGTEGVKIAGVNMNGANYGFVPEGLTFKNITFTGDVNVNNTDKWGVICKNLSIIGCTFTNAYFGAGSNSTIDGLKIENNKFNGTNTTNKTSILLQGANHTNVLVKGNTVDGSVHNAVQLAGISGKATIDGNTIKNTGSRAIRISTGEGAELTISNNIISNVNTNPTEAEENNGEVIKISGTVLTATTEGNTYGGKALTFADGIAVAPVEE